MCVCVWGGGGGFRRCQMCDQQCKTNKSPNKKELAMKFRMPCQNGRQTDFLPSDSTGRGHSTQDVQRLSQKVSDRWHLIKAENEAYDLSGQGHRQENEDSLFLIGQPAPDIIKEKISARKRSENEGWHVLSRMAPEASWVNSLFEHFDTEWQWQTETHVGEI